ncbi:bifunctional proline dehydrogenase/L-glutamate gamma-semialdehyde dehydrogenase PutA [Accumulibacter sp.]|uniref:bifunctional proline dehydrogenase/L-glutamate gamma-semialdehyde dehydrogenase PutA n=1 Tax=Accumulibacter sp. TaxID=2053492 RepID=UPI0025D68CFA|nr:bifunctional proline dehydrogenase/L-glutamate gamma-semialdehyde dehydrogenase PutA [Accumulibacter sp.]MCM8595729.1 bifunctional proline dehydrogenase/L-glutamate gamma-semialdehyde dehydrogenase PutA [Accumulibacter sp.]MDS4049876.1 bifunctional proline dehydrogenase/L-glutamate gamma-semialdehyde dehydrogenase PutA [Accumulibacter sp.]
MTAADTPLLRQRIRDYHRLDEQRVVDELIALARCSSSELQGIRRRATPLVQTVRDSRLKAGGIDAFLATYDLSSREGVVLMCLAEALLRIPDSATVDRLIRDKIGNTEWERRLGASHSTFVNAGTWALMLTGRIVNLDNDDRDLGGTLKRMVARAGEPVIRQAVIAAMRILGRQFVMGRTIGEALERARSAGKAGYYHSYDMLGESARTGADALRYFESYCAAIAAIGDESAGRPVFQAPSISIKLSALHPRYEVAQEQRARHELLPAVKALAVRAKARDIGFTIDAEEADRLELSLDLIEALATDPELAGWNGLGLAVQAYQKRALPVIDWLADLARRGGRRLAVRLCKGAYWDAEIKLAQERGLADYPVFTRKVSSDVSYLACARRLFADPLAFYPAFATHNAHTLAAVAEIAISAGGSDEWEYQRLHGMGAELYDQIVGPAKWARACRVYAPVGSHEDLLAYLVRRLLENGANSSFVNRIADAALPIDQLIADPVARAAALASKRQPRIPLPRELFGAARANSEGPDMNDRQSLEDLRGAIAGSRRVAYLAAPLIDGHPRHGQARPVCSPADRRETVGEVVESSLADASVALAVAQAAFPAWDATPAEQRAAALERAADLMQGRLPELVALIVREGGRTQADAVAEVREAIDFCRYYAAQAREKFAEPIALPGPTGERNTLELHGRGVFVCISPWNFPLAIFVGQIAAALAAGNAVVAKPAEQTPLVAALAVELLHTAGIPGGVLAFLPGDGRIGAALVAGRECAGVAFTGSTEVARVIARTLAEREGPIVPLIAETGGQNALIADSSALPEQVVRDAVASAFNSAGQRCSALRVLFVQEDIADRVCEMLAGAMQELRIGDPAEIATDVGPVIDDAAREVLEAHARRLDSFALPIHCCTLDDETTRHGSFFAPRAYQIDSLARLEREVFGPILHVIRWPGDDLDRVCQAIADTGYGLTLGIHSRIDETVRRITRRLHVGNTYVNRNIIGAVVGVQPFGGEGLSGTGPKAGGPHYLYRFASERTLSVDITAAGGNAGLMALDQDA